MTTNPHFCTSSGYPAQAQYHCETARSIMMAGVQLSSDSTDRHRILEVLINIHYTLGRAFTANKKYPLESKMLAYLLNENCITVV